MSMVWRTLKCGRDVLPYRGSGQYGSQINVPVDNVMGMCMLLFVVSVAQCIWPRFVQVNVSAFACISQRLLSSYPSKQGERLINSSWLYKISVKDSFLPPLPPLQCKDVLVCFFSVFKTHFEANWIDFSVRFFVCLCLMFDLNYVHMSFLEQFLGVHSSHTFYISFDTVAICLSHLLRPFLAYLQSFYFICLCNF